MKPFFDDYTKYKTTPVPNAPWDPKTLVVAKKAKTLLKSLLKDFDIEILHMGSSALKIGGKNDVEIYVYPNNDDWEKVAKVLENKFGKAGHTEEDFIRLNHKIDGFEVEIVQLKGIPGKMNKATFKYFKLHPDACKEYEALKKKYHYSKREYQIQKDRFFAKFVSKLPEDYV